MNSTLSSPAPTVIPSLKHFQERPEHLWAFLQRPTGCREAVEHAADLEALWAVAEREVELERRDANVAAS